MIDNLEDAIQHCKKKEEELKKQHSELLEQPNFDRQIVADCWECAREHEQLASWLEELRDYREGKRTCENCKHQNKAENQYPCSICRCNHPNMFEWAKEPSRCASERWIISDDGRCICPDCGKGSFRYKFCPNCGALNRPESEVTND